MLFIPSPRANMAWVHEAEEVQGKKWAVISISHLSDWPNITSSENCKGVLRLSFSDIDKPSSEHTIFDKSHARLILQFVKSMMRDKVEVMVVHCQAGISRSPAVCAALAELYGQNNDNFMRSKLYVPNMHVYRTLLDYGTKLKKKVAKNDS